jgi:hypothetical protein
MMMRLLSRAILLWLAVAAAGAARKYYVSPRGDNANPGTLDKPFRTIRAAADVLQPGDTCIIRAGTYREYVNPKRGGTGENQRIV